MDMNDFWTFIEHSQGADDREAFLAHRLGGIPRSDLLDFVQHLSATREPANTYRLWRAADILMEGRCSTDEFHYFQMWLVGQGRTAYDQAIANPDSLAEVPAIQSLASIPQPWPDDDYPTWESLEYVACEVGEQRPDIDGDIRDVVTDERHVTLRSDPSPTDVEWARLNPEELALRYPRLWTLFGEHWTA
ncbi:hypothetical protein BJ973_004504 [Actinoplanes tereljensis]